MGALLEHRNVGTTARYAHLTKRYLQQANNALGELVKGIGGPNRSALSALGPESITLLRG
jgi:hypothetical protein